MAKSIFLSSLHRVDCSLSSIPHSPSRRSLHREAVSLSQLAISPPLRSALSPFLISPYSHFPISFSPSRPALRSPSADLSLRSALSPSLSDLSLFVSLSRRSFPLRSLSHSLSICADRFSLCRRSLSAKISIPRSPDVDLDPAASDWIRLPCCGLKSSNKLSRRDIY